MEYSSFFNSKNGDRKYLAEDWDRHLKDLIGNGVFFASSTNLQVTADGSNMSVTVQPGAAWINGKHYLSDQAIVLPLDVADGVLNRVDRIVVRLDYDNRRIQVQVKRGTPASAAAPALQRDADAYELSLAVVAVNAGAIAVRQADIADTRMDTAVCGTVTGLINQIDTSTLYAQIQNDLQHFKADSEGDFSAWSTAQKNAFAAWRGEESDSFTTWFDHIKGQLSTDAAGNLQNQIDAITGRIPDGGAEHQVPVYGGSSGKMKWQQTHFHFTAILPASGWSSTAPYTQTVNVSGMTADMVPLVGIVQSADVDTAQDERDDFGAIIRVDSGNGTFTATASSRPAKDLNLQIEVNI